METDFGYFINTSLLNLKMFLFYFLNFNKKQPLLRSNVNSFEYSSRSKIVDKFSRKRNDHWKIVAHFGPQTACKFGPFLAFFYPGIRKV